MGGLKMQVSLYICGGCHLNQSTACALRGDKQSRRQGGDVHGVEDVTVTVTQPHRVLQVQVGGRQ